MVGMMYTNKRNKSVWVVLSVEDGVVKAMSKETKDIKFIKQDQFDAWFEKFDTKVHKSSKPRVGQELLNKFLKIYNFYVKDLDHEMTYNPKTRTFYLAVNGKNVFKIIHSKYQIMVFAHPKSLSTRALKQRVDKDCSSEWNINLSSKFVFKENTVDEEAVMKSLIVDGVFYRK